jgi:hypothetical protein
MLKIFTTHAIARVETSAGTQFPETVILKEDAGANAVDISALSSRLLPTFIHQYATDAGLPTTSGPRLQVYRAWCCQEKNFATEPTWFDEMFDN